MIEEINETEDRPGYPLLVHGCSGLYPRLWRAVRPNVGLTEIAAPLALVPLWLEETGIQGLERTMRVLWREWRKCLKLSERGTGTDWSTALTRAVLFTRTGYDGLSVALTMSYVSYTTLDEVIGPDARILDVQDLAPCGGDESEGTAVASLCMMALKQVCKALDGASRRWLRHLNGGGATGAGLSEDIWTWHAGGVYDETGDFLRLEMDYLMLVTDTSQLLFREAFRANERARVLSEIRSALWLVSTLSGMEAHAKVIPWEQAKRCLLLKVSSVRHRHAGHTDPEGVLTELLEHADQDPFVREWVRRTYGTNE